MFFPTVQLIGHVQSSYNYPPIVFSDTLMASTVVSQFAKELWNEVLKYEMKYESMKWSSNVQCYLLKIFLQW